MGPNYYLSFLDNDLHPLRNCGRIEHQLWPEQSKYPLFVTVAHNELAKNSTDICFVFEEASSDRSNSHAPVEKYGKEQNI